MPDHRETIIRLDHGFKIAEIWSEEPAVLRKLDRAKAERRDTQLGREWRRVPLERFKWRIMQDRGARQRTEAQIAASARLAESRRKPKP